MRTDIDLPTAQVRNVRFVERFVGANSELNIVSIVQYIYVFFSIFVYFYLFPTQADSFC